MQGNAPSKEASLSLDLSILAFVSQGVMGTQMAEEVDSWSRRDRRGQNCGLGGPICPPEEEFGQLYGHRRAAAGAPHVGRKVESEKWEKTVPQTCDWQKAAGVISSVKNQVSAPTLSGPIQPQWCVGRRRASLDTLPQPHPLTQEMCNCCWAMAAAGNIEALWAITYHQSVEVSIQRMAGRGLGPGAGGWGGDV